MFSKLRGASFAPQSLNVRFLGVAMSDNNGITVKSWLGLIIFLFAIYIFISGIYYQSGKDFFIGIGLMCLSYSSPIILISHFFTDRNSKDLNVQQKKLGIFIDLLAVISVVIAVFVFPEFR